MRLATASLCLFSCVLALVTLGACSSTNTVVHVTGDGGSAVDPSTLPEVSADELGADCSGFGTSIGDTAMFTSDGCAAGVCLVDARSGLNEYCSADCDKVRCPTGYLCQATTLDPARHACFKDPDAPPTDAGTVDAGPVSFLDARLTCFAKGSTAQTSFALRDFADPSGATRDLVIVLVDGAWSTYDVMQLADLDTSTYSRVEILSVLHEGAMPGGGATLADLTKWHTKYSHVDTCVDSKLAMLGPGLGTITAVPSWFVFDARTMKQIATEQGYMDTSTLPGQIETWRAMAK
jgi:hypothetical protein